MAARAVALLIGLACHGAVADAAMPRLPEIDPSDACAALAGLRPSVRTRVIASQWIAASAANPWRSPDGFRGSVIVRVPFCRLAAESMPTSESSIRFELWLPAPQDWNGRFFGTASGGSMGAIQYAALAMPLERGFAAMGHDNGHESANVYEQSWAFEPATRTLRHEKLVDFASRAQNTATVVAKEAVTAFYGTPARRAYYVGCSQGGHHGLMEAQRYPDDYDGIVAGAHGGDWTGMVASQAWAAFQVSRNDRAGALSTHLAAAVSRRATSQCDAIDGLTDGQVEDPRACAFDPVVMQCGSATADANECLTPAQVDATRAIHQGPRTAAGRKLGHGFAPGSEQYWSWNDQFRLAAGSYHDFYALLVHADPGWQLQSIDWELDVDEGRRRFGAIYDATDPDLSRFRARGGKLILYHGWSDPLIPPYLSTDMWAALNERMDPQEVAEFARLFMIPGMAHCATGPVGGTRDTHDAGWLTAIQQWVEEGITPDAATPRGTVIGVGVAGAVLRTRPYCPFPRVARYAGTGGIDRAASFTCEMP
jgi:feruloyl esterase